MRAETSPIKSPTHQQFQVVANPSPTSVSMEGATADAGTNGVTTGELMSRVAAQQRKIFLLERELQDRDDKFTRINARLDALEKQAIETKTIFHLKDIVIDRLRGEVTKLQQYTRRYSVEVSGIEKKRDKDEDINHLKTEVENILHQVDSGVTMDDVDKYHRNGPPRDGKQDVIIRFKAHSNKESVYKARKNLRNPEIKIRPSLNEANRKLLEDARNHLETFHHESNLPNPPHFVLANVHGQIQLKMTEEHDGRLFFNINSMNDLVNTISRINHTDEHDDRFNVSDSESESDSDSEEEI